MRALVTGASRGIGRAVALALAARGTKLALVARELPSLAALVQSMPSAQVLSADLSKSEEAETVVEKAHAALGGLDVVINCAGVVRYEPVGGVSHASLLEQMQVNLLSPFMIAQRAAEHMRRDKQGGVIVNVASTLGLRPAQSTAAYSASKAALISMTRSFALELGADGIRVNAVAPGVIDTDMIRAPRAAATQDTRAQLEALRALHPLGRLGTPEDVAQAVLYLIDAEFVSGAVFTVDGGLLVAS